MWLENVVETVMQASFLSVFLFYVCYFLVLYFYYRRSRNNKESIRFIYPTVSLIVPVYNEERIIEKKLQNIQELSYPSDKIETIFVDGCSTDRTSEIIRNGMRNCKKSMKLIQSEEREGYTCAITKGISSSSGEIIIVTDAASYYSPDTVEHLVKHFRSGEVGAVTGKEIVLGHNRKIGPKLEGSYRFLYDFMREAETEMDSTPDSKGEILAVRKDICNSILSFLGLSPNASFDSCVPYQAKSMGYRTVYDPQAKYYESAPSSFMDRMKQQIRRATVLIGALFLYRGMLLSRKHKKFGLVILPAHFVMQCLMPSIFLLGASCLLILTAINPAKTILVWLIGVGALVVSTKSRLFLISFFQSQVALVVAIFRLAAKRESLFIETIPSTR